ncbi:Lrp/AsnC family transcriptional regulator [Microbacterium sp. G2-8]|uniref:Lrp/AsnC family transcriptional regulator n=1 Tax=Microbacterium sp. G2-8 TaxID=2842454 RepID=UPI001C890B56|nr:Lrp/AsnC family transcriptional regulator [Microbacterium sp. G2-8]
MTRLDDLDRRIVAALLRDGRASWRRIAVALDEPERTIARQGTRLLASGAVRICALPSPTNDEGGETTFVRVRCAPGSQRAIAETMADDPRTLWVSVLAGPTEVVGEFAHRHGELAGIVDGLALAGSLEIDARPELRLHRTVSGWAPGILEEHQLDQLGPSEDAALAARDDRSRPDDLTRRLIECLRRNGRARTDDIARELEVSGSTVSRRIEAAVTSSHVLIRAVVDPALLGFPVESVVSVDATPVELDAVGDTLARIPSTRWAMNDGTRVVAQLAHADRADLHRGVRALGAVPGVTRLTISPVISIAKRSTIRYRDGRPEPLPKQ